MEILHPEGEERAGEGGVRRGGLGGAAAAEGGDSCREGAFVLKGLDGYF